MIKTLPYVFHIRGLARNFISVRKMVDVGVQTILKKYRSKKVRGEMVLMRAVQFGTV